MSWAAYIRVSTIEQTVENQREDIAKYLSMRGTAATWYEEKESSRRTRPVKNALLLRLLRGDYEGVVVHKMDRWARSLQELMLDLEQLCIRDVIFVSLNDIGEINLSTAFGKLQVQMIGAFAEFERNLILERTRAGLDRARREGKHLGRPRGAKDTRPRSRGGYFGNQNRSGKDE